MFENLDNTDTYEWTTKAYLYYKLTNVPKGSDELTSSPKGNDRSPESSVPRSNLISKNSNSSKL